MVIRRVLSVLLLFLVIGFATKGAAAPGDIELFTDEITKLKFTNLENWLDNDESGTINAGDQFVGILRVTSIEDLFSIDSLNAQLLDRELTGNFQITVTGGEIAIGGTGHLDFGLESGDFIRLFVDDDPDFAGTLATATDGDLWASILPGTFYEGINDTTGSFPTTESTNRNWANLTQNLTGYTIVPQNYSSAAGENPLHIFDGNLHGDHLVDLYFASRLFNTIGAQHCDPLTTPGSECADGTWHFRSEDPLYLFATVPEPSSMLLFGLGLLSVAAFARHRSKKSN